MTENNNLCNAHKYLENTDSETSYLAVCVLKKDHEGNHEDHKNSVVIIWATDESFHCIECGKRSRKFFEEQEFCASCSFNALEEDLKIPLEDA